jgi:hypothetical protein
MESTFGRLRLGAVLRRGPSTGSSSEAPAAGAENTGASSPALESRSSGKKGKGTMRASSTPNEQASPFSGFLSSPLGTIFSNKKLDGQYSPPLEPASNSHPLESLMMAFPHLDPGHAGIDSQGRTDHSITQMQRLNGLSKRIGSRIHKLPLPILDQIISYCVLRPYLYPFRYPTNSVSHHHQSVFTGIFHLSKRISKRASYLLYTQNGFHFRHASDLTAFTVAIGPENAKRIRYLTVALTLRPFPWMKVEDDIMTAERYVEMTATDPYPAKEEHYMQAVHQLAVVKYLGLFYAPLAALVLSSPNPNPSPSPLPASTSSSFPPSPSSVLQEQILARLGIPHHPPNGKYNVFPNLKGVEIDIQDVRCARGCHGVWACEVLLPVLRALRDRCCLLQVSKGDGWEET